MLAAGACCLLTSCATHQRITLETPQGALPAGHAIQLIDLRGNDERQPHLSGRPHCSRSYGDEFIVPSKTEYLREVLEAKSAPGAGETRVTLSKFETVEYCDGTVARTRPSGLAAVTAGVTHGQVLPPSGAPTDVRGDAFELHLAGTINGRAFDVSERFDYDDLKFVNFPEENPEYRKRIEQAIDAAADKLLATGAGPSTAQ
jgi:hypothetical protein